MTRPSVFVTDDDDSIRRAISFLLRSEGIPHRLASSARELLEQISPEDRGCILLDVRMPGMDGLELQQALQQRKIRMPIIFISGHADISMAVRAIQAGALDFVEKPFDDEQLIEKVRNALEFDQGERHDLPAREEVEQRLGSLTPRECEVMEGILEGKLNKIIADDLGISVRTVEIHRANAMEKLAARNSSELIRMVLSSHSYRNWLL